MDRNERIRQRAHQIWEAAGHPEGQEADHWRQAEEQVGRDGQPDDPGVPDDPDDVIASPQGDISGMSEADDHAIARDEDRLSGRPDPA